MTRSPTARLFVAVDPPEDVRRALAGWARSAVRAACGRARGATPPRLLDPELLHVTLCFLGNRPAEEIDSLGAQLAACAGPAGELSMGAPLWLPARRPRVLAIELHDERDRLARLQRDVVAALEEVSGWQPNGSAPGAVQSAARRRFHPHITVARMGRAAAPRERLLPPTPALSFVPTELVLYRSWLTPEGASYEAVASRAAG
jgi:RNA 2',3'-cyclic 3'-phosphodiesterase